MIALAKLAALVVAAVPTVGQARASEVARHTAAAAGDDVSEAVLLLVTEEGESKFRREVESCTVTGDDGKALTGYQLHRHHLHFHTAEEVCGDPVLAAKLARRALATEGDITSRIAVYMGRKPRDKEVKRRAALYERLMSEVQDGA